VSAFIPIEERCCPKCGSVRPTVKFDRCYVNKKGRFADVLRFRCVTCGYGWTDLTRDEEATDETR
jgi:hypothetical protein